MSLHRCVASYHRWDLALTRVPQMGMLCKEEAVDALSLRTAGNAGPARVSPGQEERLTAAEEGRDQYESPEGRVREEGEWVFAGESKIEREGEVEGTMAVAVAAAAHMKEAAAAAAVQGHDDGLRGEDLEWKDSGKMVDGWLMVDVGWEKVGWIGQAKRYRLARCRVSTTVGGLYQDPCSDNPTDVFIPLASCGRGEDEVCAKRQSSRKSSKYFIGLFEVTGIIGSESQVALLEKVSGSGGITKPSEPGRMTMIIFPIQPS